MFKNILSNISSPASIGPIIAAIIAGMCSCIAIPVTGYFLVKSAMAPTELSIEATQKAEYTLTTDAKLTEMAMLISPSKTPTNTSTPSPTNTITSIYTPTLTKTNTVTLTPQPYFFDNFCSAGIDIGLWEVLSEGFYTENCRLIADYENTNTGWGEQLIQAKINKRFFTVEFKAEVIESTQIAKIGIETSCNNNSLFFELKGDGRLKGYIDENPDEWEYFPFQTLEFNQAYTIRLVQEGDGVHVFINNVEMENIYPCNNMGQYLNIGAGGETGHQVSGLFEYVYLWTESVLP